MIINRNIKPAENGKISFHLPEIKKLSLANGLEIYYVHKPELPIVQMNLICNAGSKFDPENKKGLALLTSMLVDEGAGEYSALELDDEFESMGTVVKISADQDSVFINTLSLVEHFNHTLELFSKIILQPKFNDNDFERERNKLMDKIIQLSDEPSYIASTNYEKIIFTNHPYSHPTVGISSQINSITNNDVRQLHAENFNVSNSKLVVVGNIDAESLQNKINNFFAGWKSSELKEVGNPEKTDHGFRVLLIDKKDAAQSELRIGHLGNPRNTMDFYAKILMNAILGGQFSSRINLNLREDKGYTYGVNSGFHYHKMAGYFSVSTAVQSENTLPAIKEIIKELNLIREDVKQKELEFAKAYLINRFPSMFETYSQVAAHLSSKILYNLPDDYFDTYLDIIDAVNLEEVKNAAIDNVFPDSLNIVIVGNKKLLLDDLNKNFEASVIEIDIDGNKI